MNKQLSSIEGVLKAMGVSEKKVQAALAVINGSDHHQHNNELQEEDEILTPQELCERLSISTTTLWRLNPPCIRVLGRKRYFWEEVREFLAASAEPRRENAL